MELKIRIGRLSDLAEIQKLFSDSITFVCSKDYNQTQIEAWKLAAQNSKPWQKIIENQYFILAELNQIIVGFASLENYNYIDVLFVHKDFQRQGIAQALFDKLIYEARKFDSQIITSDVSKTAKAFFETNGFIVVAEQIKTINNVEIQNYKMQKTLLY